MEQPREIRTELQTIADISDSKHFYKGIAVNVSRNGLKIIDVPEKYDFYSEGGHSAVMTVKGKHYKFFMQPRWSKKKGISKSIGFRIISPPLEWIKFINELEGQELAGSR